ncbi:MAG: hypothetical protein RO469_16120 [Thermincola sp.]|jgi:hypothetical protein|nr:hypothetical protein [Thermincola sp.]
MYHFPNLPSRLLVKRLFDFLKGKTPSLAINLPPLDTKIIRIVPRDTSNILEMKINKGNITHETKPESVKDRMFMTPPLFSQFLLSWVAFGYIGSISRSSVKNILF